MRHDGLSPSLNHDDQNQDTNENKIELLGCPFSGKNCRTHLKEINRNYLESGRYQQEKHYQKAIEHLKAAYYMTHELQQSTCVKCAALFRTTITQTLEEMHKDLERMSTGIFRNRRYYRVYIEAGNVLKEMTQNK